MRDGEYWYGICGLFVLTCILSEAHRKTSDSTNSRRSLSTVDIMNARLDQTPRLPLFWAVVIDQTGFQVRESFRLNWYSVRGVIDHISFDEQQRHGIYSQAICVKIYKEYWCHCLGMQTSLAFVVVFFDITNIRYAIKQKGVVYESNDYQSRYMLTG